MALFGRVAVLKVFQRAVAVVEILQLQNLKNEVVVDLCRSMVELVGEQSGLS